MNHLLPLFLFSLSTMAAQSAGGLADLPDPLVGTDSSYEVRTGTPSGRVPAVSVANWTAQTGKGGWTYQYSKESIRGFRCTHRPSAWMTDYGAFALMPVTGELKVLPEERASRFRHERDDWHARRRGSRRRL